MEAKPAGSRGEGLFEELVVRRIFEDAKWEGVWV